MISVSETARFSFESDWIVKRYLYDREETGSMNTGRSELLIISFFNLTVNV